jgi:PKD repeat protein
VRTPATLAAGLFGLLAFSGCFGGPSGASGSDALQADFAFSPESPAVGKPVVFVDTSEGDIESRMWEFGDGDVSTEAEPAHVFAAAGVYTVRLEVTDASGARDSAERHVPVGVAGEGPFSVDFQTNVKGLTVSFLPIVKPTDVRPDSYFWDFGDGEVSRDRAPVHAYAMAARYTVVLRVVAEASVVEYAKTVDLSQGAAGGLAGRSFAVIAVVDSGINPYHDEFRDPAFTAHPSTYIDRYPADAAALELSFDASQFSKAVSADEEVWDSVGGRTLYWIPGTRIVGAVSVEADGANRILDDNGHGTATASVAAGATIGTCDTCLIVAVEGLGPEPLEWAMEQPWIDVVSNSWTLCLATCQPNTGIMPGAPVSTVDPEETRQAVEKGKTVVFAAGNGMMNAFDVPQVTYANAYSGPDWIVTVGAADADSGSTVAGTGRPVDVVGYGLGWKGASHTSFSAVGGF